MTNDIVLLHGGTLGSWCWERLRPELEAANARVTAPDLPLSDPEAGFDACVRAARDALPADCGRPLVVAHSASGNYLPLAAKALGARRMVFLCAALPREGMSWNEQVLGDPSCVLPAPPPSIDDRGRLVFPPDAARDVFFSDCSAADQEWAVRRMVPFAQTVPSETFPVGGFDGAPPAEYVLGTLDRILSPEWHRRSAERLVGKPCIEIKTGHSPFLADPGSLASVLLAL